MGRGGKDVRRAISGRWGKAGESPWGEGVDQSMGGGEGGGTVWSWPRAEGRSPLELEVAWTSDDGLPGSFATEADCWQGWLAVGRGKEVRTAGLAGDGLESRLQTSGQQKTPFCQLRR